MSWGRIDDTAPENKKWARLEAKHGARAWADASAVWFCVLCYANRNLTDGFILTVVLARLTPLGQAAIDAAEVMVGIGLMDRAEDGYVIHDFLEYNDSAEHIRAKRKADSDRQKARRRKDDGTYVQPDVPTDIQTDTAETNAGRLSTPSRPVPSRTTNVVVGGDEDEDEASTPTHSTIDRGPSARKAYGQAIEAAGGTYTGGSGDRDHWRRAESLAVAFAARSGGDPQSVLDGWAARYCAERKTRRPAYWLERVEAWASESVAPAVKASAEPSDDAIQRAERRLAAQRLARAGGAS